MSWRSRGASAGSAWSPHRPGRTPPRDDRAGSWRPRRQGTKSSCLQGPAAAAAAVNRMKDRDEMKLERERGGKTVKQARGGISRVRRNAQCDAIAVRSVTICGERRGAGRRQQAKSSTSLRACRRTEAKASPFCYLHCLTPRAWPDRPVSCSAVKKFRRMSNAARWRQRGRMIQGQIVSRVIPEELAGGGESAEPQEGGACRLRGEQISAAAHQKMRSCNRR